MAMSLSHQIGALSGTAIPSETGTTSSDSTGVVSTAAWKSQPSNLRCRIHKQGPEIDAVSPPVSPISPFTATSPVLGGSMRPDLSVACQAFATDAVAETAKEGTTKRAYREGGAQVKGKGVPVYVMMPLDSVTSGNAVNRRKAMNASLMALKSAGVEGVMMDVWWGLVERDAPGAYNWGGYTELLEMAKKHGLKVQAVMSFHQCGGNVGDSCTIPLPKWAVEEINKDQDLAYTDQWGRRNCEYISLGCDNLPVLKGRTPVQCYSDFMQAFRDNFKHLLGDTIVEIQVGMGPRKLFEAARTGNVEALLHLLQENPLILAEVALISPEETPLHVAAKAGHPTFVREMVKRQPQMAGELNKDGFRAMDIASANGYVDIVQELLAINRDLCRLKGRDKRTALHYAAIKGRVEIINELVSACPDSVKDVTAQTETALHTAAKNNQFEAFQVLIQWQEWLKMEEIVNWQDQEGNTVLHLVTARKQLESIELLLKGSNNTRRVLEVNATNAKGLTAMDVLDVLLLNPGDIKLRELLQQAGALPAQDVNPIVPATCLQKIQGENSSKQELPPEPSKDWFKYFQFNMDRDSPSDARNALLVVAALVATVTFQAGISPPDGIVRMEEQIQSNNGNTTRAMGPGPRASIEFGSRASTYLFLFGNTVGLSASTSIITYLTANFPFQREMVISMYAMMFTYGCSIASITPMTGTKFLLVVIALILPFLARRLPRLVKQVWKCMRQPSVAKIKSTFRRNSFPCIQI